MVDEKELWFEKFWQEYPRKVSKAQAKKTFFKKCTNKDTYNAIMDGLHKAISYQWQNREQQYIPHPTTWLSQNRWEDDIVATSGNPFLDSLMKEIEDEQTGSNEDTGDNPFGLWQDH